MKIVFGVMVMCLSISLITGFAQAAAMYGDVDGDDDVDSHDVALVLQNSVGSINLTPQQKVLADVSGDGSITVYDAVLILRHTTDSIDAFPVENGERGPSGEPAAAPPIDVNMSVPNASGPSGSSVTIPINVTDTTGKEIVGADITLTYDSDILIAIDAVLDGTIASGWFITDNPDNVNGVIRISMYDLSQTGLSGAGALVKVNFNVSATASIGETSPLTFSKATLVVGIYPNPAEERTPTTTDGVFTVTPSGAISITVLSPNGGEKIKGGGIYSISWTTTGTGIHHVHLLCSENGGATYQDITPNTAYDEPYDWSVPSLDLATVRVKAIAEGADNSELAADASNGDFIVDSTAPETGIDLEGTEGKNGWYTSKVTVTLLPPTDDLSGVKYTKYKVNTDPWETYDSPFDVNGSTVYYYSEDNAGNVEDEEFTEIKIDKTPPVTPTVTDDGEYTTDGSKLHAVWESSDAESGIVAYQYAIGKTSGGHDVVDWTPVGLDTEVTKPLTLTLGQIYYFSVEAKNEAGLPSIGYSDGITYQLPQIDVTPTSLTFNAVVGGVDPDAQILSITNSGVDTLNWTISDNAGWLFCNPPSGDCTGEEIDEVTVSVNIGGLPKNTYNGTIIISATLASNTPQAVPVVLNVTDLIIQKEIHLYSGWNIMSVCLDIGDTDLLSVLEPIEGLYVSVYTYDAALEIWRRYVPDGPAELNNLSTIEVGKGYLINMIQDYVLPIEGTEITNTFVQLYRGWNLAGYNSTEPQLRGDALSSIADDYTYISTYDGQQGSWLRYTVYAPNPSQTLDQLGPGYGYWIHVEDDCEWILPSP